MSKNKALTLKKKIENNAIRQRTFNRKMLLSNSVEKRLLSITKIENFEAKNSNLA